jgi:hypothetical protein
MDNPTLFIPHRPATPSKRPDQYTCISTGTGVSTKRRIPFVVPSNLWISCTISFPHRGLPTSLRDRSRLLGVIARPWTGDQLRTANNPVVRRPLRNIRCTKAGSIKKHDQRCRVNSRPLTQLQPLNKDASHWESRRSHTTSRLHR